MSAGKLVIPRGGEPVGEPRSYPGVGVGRRKVPTQGWRLELLRTRRTLIRAPPTVEGELNVDPVTLKEFEDMICKDFVGPGPYLGYIYPTIDDEMNATTYCQPLRSPSNTSTSMSLSYGQRYPSPPKSFEDMIHKDFVSPGPYPTYILPSMPKSTPPPTANPFTAPANASMSLSYRQRYPSPPESFEDMIRKDFVRPGPYIGDTIPMAQEHEGMSV